MQNLNSEYSQRHDRGLSIEDAGRFLKSNESTPPIEVEIEFPVIATPAHLKGAIIELAESYRAGKILMTDVQASLKGWGELLKSRNILTNVEALKRDFDDALDRQPSDEAVEVSEERPALSDEELKLAIELGQSDLDKGYNEALGDLAYFADEYMTIAEMHTVYSRLLPARTGWLHHGCSRSGKSAGLEAAFKLLHPVNRRRITSISPKAIYSLGRLDHVFILGGELYVPRAGEDDETQRIFRQFISEPEITHVRLEESVKKRWHATENTVSGYAAIAWTTTREPRDFDKEFGNRLTTVASNESKDTTAKVLSIKSAHAKDPIGWAKREEATIKRWNLFDLSLKSYIVKIPFSDRIEPQNLDDDPIARERYNQLLHHIRISTLIHQHAREVDQDGCLLATKQDYTRGLVVAQKSNYEVNTYMNSAATEAYQRLADKLRGSEERTLTQAQIADIVGKSRASTQDYIKAWTKMSLVSLSDEVGKDRAKKYYFPNDASIDFGPGLGLVSVEEAFPDEEQTELAARSAESIPAPQMPVRTGDLGSAAGASRFSSPLDEE